MRILFDATILDSRGTGFERYAREILNALSKFPVEVFAIVSSPGVDVPNGVTKISPWTARPSDLKLQLFRQVSMASIVRELGIDIFFCPVPEVSIFLPCPQVAVIHDVIPLVFPETDRNTFRFLKTILPRLINRLSAIATPSIHSKMDIEKAYPYFRGEVLANPNAFSKEIFFPRTSDETANAKLLHGLTGKPFTLFLGEARPYKNIEGLVKAFAEIKGETYLAIAGKLGKMEAAIREVIVAHKMEERVLLLGYVSDSDLAALYSSCEIFVFGSFYEGFGIPPLEAMACGAPVVCSNASSLPEVCGEAAVYFDPHQHHQVVAAIQNTLGDHFALQALREKSLLQAAGFSYQKAAENLISLFQRLI